MIPLIERAMHFAIAAHDEQVRKYTGVPYIFHPIEVATILLHVGIKDENIIAAALLHDVVEDTSVTFEELESTFSPEVAQLVREVSKISQPEDGNRYWRMRKDRDHYANASIDGRNIKLADLISNTRDIKQHDPNFAVVYLKEKREILEVLTGANPTLYAMAVTQAEGGLA